MSEKVSWQGRVLAVKPRIRLVRSYDQRSHVYLGFSLFLDGSLDEELREFSVGLGKAAQAKHLFRTGDVVSGTSSPVADNRFGERRSLQDERPETSLKRAGVGELWPALARSTALPRDLSRERASSSRCSNLRRRMPSLHLGCRMPVEMTIDHWNPQKKKYRVERFCYGPKSCRLYPAGATRKVPGRHAMQWVGARLGRRRCHGSSRSRRVISFLK